MKKLIVLFLLFAVLSSICVFAEDPETETEAVTETAPEAEPETAPETVTETAPEAAPETAAAKKKLINSIQVEGGFDLFTAKSKIIAENHKNSAAAAGFDVALSLDLNSIPHFLKEGWYARLDFGLFFPSSVTILDVKYNKKESDDVKTLLGYKAHIAILRQVDFNIPIDICFGIGYSHNMLYGRIADIRGIGRTSVNSWGASLFATADYRFFKRFAATVTVNADFTFLTRYQTKYKDDSGWVETGKQTAANFGFDLGVKAGLKYFF